MDEIAVDKELDVEGLTSVVMTTDQALEQDVALDDEPEPEERLDAVDDEPDDDEPGG